MEPKRTNNCYPIKLRFDRWRTGLHDERWSKRWSKDKKRKEEVDLRNEVDQAIFATEKGQQNWYKGFDAERDAARAALMILRKPRRQQLTKWSKTWSINKKHKDLLLSSTEQAAAQQAQAGAEAQATEIAGDDVVDGEFTEK